MNLVIKKKFEKCLHSLEAIFLKSNIKLNDYHHLNDYLHNDLTLAWKYV